MSLYKGLPGHSAWDRAEKIVDQGYAWWLHETNQRRVTKIVVGGWIAYFLSYTIFWRYLG